jgi:gamma-glutamylcyclotransferase (GGCT)/AIG2-like uncharacterized protein YtfP
VGARAAADRLFVYGTLRAGRAPRALAWLEARPREPARVAGSLLDLGAYPGWTPEGPPDAEVLGELVAVPPGRWPALDRYEGFVPSDPAGSLFVRERTVVRARAGEVACWIYRYAGPAGGRRRVPGGDWCAAETRAPVRTPGRPADPAPGSPQAGVPSGRSVPRRHPPTGPTKAGANS